MENLLKTQTKEYGIGLDIIRIIAMFLVIVVHSTSFYGFLEEDISSFSYVIVSAGRYFAFTCVPLFILLTGYLNCKKTPTIKYYLKIIRIIIEFCLCGIIIALFYSIYFNYQTPAYEIFKKILYFSYPKYSWYIKMYVGIFLIAPFLNYIINNISKKQAVVFIIFLLLIFSQPNITDYWQIAYPLMYYFIGAILYVYPVKIKKIWLLLIIIVTCFLQVLIYVYPVLPRYLVETHNNIGCAIITISLFLMFYKIKICVTTKGKLITAKIARLVANASLSTYLISEIFESLTTKAFSEALLFTFSQRLPHLLYITPLKFITAVACGIIIHIIALLLYELVLIVCRKIKLRFQNQKTIDNAENF